jgi:Right handed beta helix region
MVYSHGSDNLIYNNLIYNVGPFASSAMQLQNTNDQVYNNTIADSPKVGVLVQGASNLTMRNNIIRNTGQVPIMQVGDDGTTFSHNLCTATATGCAIVGNPNLASDYKLTAASTLAINAGFPLPGVVTVDQAGNARPAGAGWDIGAFQYGGTVTPLPAPTNLSLTPTP